MTCKCKKCNQTIYNPAEDARTINEGTEAEYTVCEPCFDAMWDLNEITKCAGCGRWYENGVLHSDPNVEDFTPCPVCGLDVIEGYSREEATRQMNERKENNKFMESANNTPDIRKNAEATILEMANIIRENQQLRMENNELRLRVATLEALVDAMRPGGDYDKYNFLADIEAQNAAYRLHKAAGYVSTIGRVDNWEQKLAEFEAARKARTSQ